MADQNASLAIAAAEYGYDPMYFRRMLDAVDVLQADATRCAGSSEFLRVGAMCDADGTLLSELRPDLTRPGMGLELKRADAARYEQ